MSELQDVTPEQERDQFVSLASFLTESRARLIETMLQVEAIDPYARTSLMLRRTLDVDQAAWCEFRGEPLPDDLSKRMRRMNRKDWHWTRGTGDNA